MKIVLLAAGIGNRLGPLTKDLPKSLITLKNKPILDYVMETLLQFPVTELIVVGGFAFNKLADHLRGKDERIRVVENKNYLKGSILTLECALSYLDSDFFLFNADHIYPKSLIPKLLENKGGIVGMCDFDRSLTDDDMKISCDENKHIMGISKKLTQFDGGYIGITYCGRDSLELYKETVLEVIKKTEGKGVVEEVLSTLIQKGSPPTYCNTSGISWLEVDTPEDLAIAESKIESLFMTLIQSLIISFIEGVTEFLPISSTGHMIITSHFMGLNDEKTATFEIFIQLGAILAVVAAYPTRFLKLFNFKSSENFSGVHGFVRLGITTLPALAMGGLFHHWIKAHLFTPETVILGLVSGGVAIIILEKN